MSDSGKFVYDPNWSEDIPVERHPLEYGVKGVDLMHPEWVVPCESREVALILLDKFPDRTLQSRIVYKTEWRKTLL